MVYLPDLMTSCRRELNVSDAFVLDAFLGAMLRIEGDDGGRNRSEAGVGQAGSVGG